MAEIHHPSSLLRWLSENPQFKPILTNQPADEIDLARQVYESEEFREAVKTYYYQLKPLVICDADESNKLRNKANILYKEHNELIKAAYLYTKAIYKAPINSSSLARAHANRAIVLYKLQYYEAAFEDCACAVEFNHPSVYAVLARQVAIAWKLKDHQKMQHCIKTYHNFNMEVPRSVEAYYKQLKGPSFADQQPAELSDLKGPTFDKLKLSRNVAHGRLYMATENIEAGELILEDNLRVHSSENYEFRQAFFSDKEEELVFTCENCCEPDIVPFPCYECRCVFYCSKKCREKHTYIHRFECKGYKIQLFDETWLSSMTLRYLLTTLDDILRKLQQMNKGGTFQTAEKLWPILLQTAKDGELLSLHSNLKHLVSYVEYGLIAFIICYYLSDQTDFFDRTYRDRLTVMPSEDEWHIIVIALYLRFASTASLNAISLMRLSLRKPFTANTISVKGLYSSLIVDYSTVGIFPWFCFFNHSCDANTQAYFSGLKIKIYSKRSIARGEELTFDYLYESANKSKDERKDGLEHFLGNLDCDCKRCQNEEDPILVKYIGAPCACGGNCLCRGDSFRCSKCGEIFDLELFLTSAALKTPDSPEEFIYCYGINAILRKRFGDMCCDVYKSLAGSLLREYLNSTNAKVLRDHAINSFMIKLAVDLLGVTQKNPYCPYLDSAMHAAMLLDIVAIRKKIGLEPLDFDYSMLVEEAIWFVTGKPRKMFDKFKLYSF